MLADENQLLHPVAIGRIPVVQQVGLLPDLLDQFVFRHRGKPQADVLQHELAASLLKEVASVEFFAEITDALGPDHIPGPFLRHKVVKRIEIERPARLIDVCADAIFLGLPFSVVMMVMMLMILVFVVIVIIVIILVMFHFLDPGGGGGHVVKLEHARVEDLVEIEFTVVTFDDLCLRLERPDDGPDPAQLLRRHVRHLVEGDDVAEFNLLNDEALDILFVEMRLLERIAAGKFTLHAHRVDHGNHAVKHGNAVLDIFKSQRRNRTDGLGDRLRLTDAARLDNDVVERLPACDLTELLDQIVFEGAADAAVLESNETLVFLAHNPAFLNQVGIDVDFSDIIDNHRKADALAVVEDAVDQGGLAAAQIAGQQQDRYFFQIFHTLSIYCFFSKCW